MNKNELGKVKAKDVKEIAIELMKKTRYWAFCVLGITFLLVYVFVVTGGENDYLMIFSIILIMGYIGYIYDKAQAMFMKQFAEDNGFDYQKTASIETVYGKLFEIGHSRHISNVISGIHKDHPMRIFNYTFTVGYGRNSQTYSFTVLELFFEKVDFPHILLRSKKMSVYRGLMGKTESISLEDEFKRDFDFFVQKGYEIEAMQIFTPETLRIIKEKAAKFSIEFYGKTVCFFDNKKIGKNNDLQELYGVTEKVFDSMSPLLNRLYDDFKVLHKYYRDKS